MDKGNSCPGPQSPWDLAGVSKVRTVMVPWLQGPDYGHTRSFLERGSFSQPRHLAWEKDLPTACEGVSMKPPGGHPASSRTPGRPLICRHL